MSNHYEKVDIGALLSDAAEDLGYDEDFDDELAENLRNSHGMDALKLAAKHVEKLEDRLVESVLAEETDKIIERVSHTHESDDEVAVKQSFNDNIDHDGSDDDSDDFGGHKKVYNEQIGYLNTMFLGAVTRGDKQEINRLLSMGADIQCIDRHGWTAIHWAAVKGFDDIIDLVMNHQLFPQKRKQIMQFLNSKEFISGWTPLHVASVHCHLKCIGILLRGGCDANVINKLGETALESVGNGIDADPCCKLLDEYVYSSHKNRLQSGGGNKENNNNTGKNIGNSKMKK